MNKEEKLIIDYMLVEGDSFYFHHTESWEIVDTVREVSFAGGQVRFIDFGPRVGMVFLKVMGPGNQEWLIIVRAGPLSPTTLRKI